MIQTGFESRVKIQQIIDNQLPNFILDENPNAAEFLKQYYISQEYQGGPTDIAENLDQYLKLDNLTPEVVVDSTILTIGITTTSNIITVNSTKGFPQTYGLLKIDDEIITYTGLTTNTFTGCIRGFSAITDYHDDNNQEELVFKQSVATSHTTQSFIQNLSSLFLKEFYKKIKYTFIPGLEEYELVSNLNVGNFIKEAKSFYQAKGTDESFRILFNILYGVTPRVVNLENFLIKASHADYIRREIAIAEKISGNPLNLSGQTLYKAEDKDTFASISEIEPFTRNNRQYFKISLFVGYTDISAIEGNFTITPNTRCLESVSIGSSVISVDSTIGFKKSGIIISGNNTITYTDKSINQFFGCSGIGEKIPQASDIRSNEIYYGYENGDISKKVELRLTGVLSKFVQVSDSLNLDEGQIISVKSIGDLIENPEKNRSYKEIFANSWIYNTSSRYQVKDNNNFILKSKIDRSSLKIGDKVEVLKRGTSEVVSSSTAYISNINDSENKININELGFTIGIGTKYDVRRKLNSAYSSSNVPIEFGNNAILSDIQNLYTDDEYAYVASNSLPSASGRDEDYGNFTYKIEKNIQFNTAVGLSSIIDDKYTKINFGNTVPFITGDRIYYQPSGNSIVGLNTGDYYVQVSNPDNIIRLYSSRSFVGTDNFLTFKESTFNEQNQHKFTIYSQKSNIIGSQKLLKKFKLTSDIDSGIQELTLPGTTGMLINGVEISNYKSDDKIYYGPIQSIDILNQGKNYDVINPPEISISSGSGTTALVRPVISGSIQKVYIDSQDYDINSIVSIGISGGNGSGASIQPILTKRQRDILFDGRTIANSGGISTNTGQLTFLSNHNLIDGESIIYDKLGNLEIGFGSTTLVNKGEYYAKIDNSTTIRLYQNISDYYSGINTVFFNGNNNSGVHKFKTSSYKNTISEIKILNQGSGYTNRKLIVKSSGISTINHTISFENHGFNSGELVKYNYQTSSIGISTVSQYYILSNDKDYFRLCDAGIGGTNISNYNRENYIKLPSIGSGYQYFSYPDISVSIEYSPVGLVTQYQSLVTTPVVKGSIIDTYLYENGTGYGSTILNLEKNQTILIKNGKDAKLRPIIRNGRISFVNIQYSGIDYYSIPDLIVTDSSGAGSGAELRPIISNGKIIDVKIINSGINYSDELTNVIVKPSGYGALLRTRIRALTVNNNSRFGDELIFESNNKLQYSVCGYFEILRNSFGDTGEKVSNIIGWAYDGNPIYGPYGFSDPETISIVKRLSSGYSLNVSNIIDRPPSFAPGFFVEDYTYTNSGDLDENNGRFGKTPEFPNGIYAYFATLSSSLVPEFPYFIGNKYRSNTLKENSILNQTFDFNNSSLLRNTFPYKISDEYADNDFIIETRDFTNQESVVESVSDGSITDFDIIFPGVNYKINDILSFDDSNTMGGGLSATVSSIEGKDIVELNTSVQTYENAIFTRNNDRELQVTILPSHNLSNNDVVVISGLSTSLSQLNSSYKIGVTSYSSNILTSIPAGSSGFTTEIYVIQIPENISVDSNISIGSEILKVLEVFSSQNILKVSRGSSGISHTATSRINFIPNSFKITKKTEYFESEVPNKVYFNPKNSVGVGTTSGITNAISFNFASYSITRDILTQSIYIENHPFINNQSVIFTTNGNPISISTSPNGPQFSLPSSIFVVNKNKNTIGIKTDLNSSEVYFRNNGSDSDQYSFTSTNSTVTGKVEKIKSTVSISTFHGLTNNDNINLKVYPNLSVGIGTSLSIFVKRDQTTGNVLINPIGFNSTGINTSTSIITINSHNLQTGDKILYSSNSVASGLNTGSYYVFKINDNSIKLSETYSDSKKVPPTTISIASTGGSNQTISLLNPQIKTILNNNLVFKLSDNSLSGFNFKIYYDQEYNNEFISTSESDIFTVSGIGTVGVSTNASLTIKYDSSLPTKLYYNIENSGSITSSDESVINYSEILFDTSVYTSNYSISGIGSTTFDISLIKIPEKLKYVKSECDILTYTTNSLSANGSISKINIVSGGSGYKKIPIFSGSNSLAGKDAYIIPKSTTIGNLRELRIVDEGFEYSSDKTLSPLAYVSPLITIKDLNSIDSIIVTNGGTGYNNPPTVIIVDSKTGKKINSGILESSLVGNSIDKINIIQKPKGLPETSVKIFTTNNTNGVSIQKIESSSSGIFTCFITTPTSQFITNPFNIGDKVFVEGIEKSSSEGTGFNSEDYNYQLFTISNYNNAEILDKVTINISGLTTNTGIAKTIQDSIPNIIKSTDYPEFEVLQTTSSFLIGEKIIINNSEVDLSIQSYSSSFIKVSGSYKLTVGESITGKDSGNIAIISGIEENTGKFDINYSVEKNIGWSNDSGKLNQDNQVISDNDYYQNLSYTIKSPISYKDLKTPVNNLLHSSGFKNFSDTGITSTTNSGISSSNNATSIVYDVIEENRVDTIYDFDLVQDVDIVGAGTSSKFIRLKTKKLSDYIECKTNVVLKIDDINRQFSNLDGEPSEFLNLIQLNSGVSYDNLLVRVSSLDNTQIQLSELVLINSGNNNNFLAEKSTLINKGTGFVHNSEDKFGSFSLIEDETGVSYLRFLPNDPFNVDYDIKFISSKFGSGIGTTSIGLINLSGLSSSISPTITTPIISVESNKCSSLYANVQIINSTTNEMNFVEIFVNHNGTDTFISQYFFDSEFSSNYYSGNFIGSFSSNISSGILSLNYSNISQNNNTINSKIVGFGTTALGTGSYRFLTSGEIPGNERSVVYQSNYSSTVSAPSTIISLNKNNINALKSLVEVSVGSTSALHQITMIQDLSNIYIQQSPFLSGQSTTGIGTFGGEYSGDNFILKFYPDAEISSLVKISAFTQCLYTILDDINVPPDLLYGNITESINLKFYNAINGNRLNRTKFNLTSEGNKIFTKIFNPSDSLVLNPVTGIFSIENHYLSPQEEIIYTPKSTFIGIGASSVGIGATLNSSGIVTTLLPSDLYVIKLSNNTFKLSTRKDYSALGIGVTFTSIGEGNAHQLEMVKKNEKVIITIDNLVQYPLLFTPISHTLSNNNGQISASSSIISLSGISTIVPNNILKIDNEFLEIVNVGLGTTNTGPITNSGNFKLVEVNRGFVGSSATSHIDSSEARVYKGSYNIVENNIFFTKAPRGNPQIERDISNLIFETADFTGRVFLRNNYTSNKIYDDISSRFTGIGRTFTLTVGGANTVGLGTSGGNGMLFINSIFQTPTTLNNPNNNFRILENSGVGISSVVFSGVTIPNTDTIFTSDYDINQNQIPRGGIIISLGSSTGLGYAPLVGAAVTAVLDANGGIISVGLGTTDNVGSGYNGIVSIGVSAYESGHNGTPASISASVGIGGTLTFTVGVGGTGYVNPKIFVSEPSYENLNIVGVSRLGIGATTKTGIGLLLNVEVGASSTTGIGSTYFEITKFNISRQGYSFQRGDVFTPVGLVTDSRLGSPLSKFELTVVNTFTDSFAAWQFGEFDFIDSIKNYQDGTRTRFPLFYNNELLSFQVLSGSQVNLSNALLIIINGVIQDPGVSYQFDGGTSFAFTAAPKEEDNIAIFFYKGTTNDDSKIIDDINETIKKGDIVQVLKNNAFPDTISQNKRTVFDLTSSDKFETNFYNSQGIDDENDKPLSWIKQKSDQKINGEIVYKSRDSLESLIYPTARIIKNFSTTDDYIFTDNADFFKYQISNPTKFDALIVNGISTIASQSVEKITNITSVTGFSGIVTGIGTTTGTNGNPLAINFNLIGLKVQDLSQLQVGYPIYIFDTRVGNGLTSINTTNSSIVGIGTTFIDNIYYIHQISSTGTTGIITCNILSTTSTTGISSSGNVTNPVGKFSWGRMSGFSRSSSPISIGVTGNTIDVGLSTFATIQRRNTGLRKTGALPKLL